MDKKTLLLLHAFPLNKQVWREQIAALGDQYNIIAPDFRGFGENAGQPNDEPFSLTDLADDVKRLIDHLNLGPVVVAGLSMGGYVAAALVAKYPQVVKGLIFIDSKTEPDGAEAKAGRGEMIKLAQEKGAGAIAAKMVPKLLAENASAELKREVQQMAAACPVSTIVHALAAMRDRPDQTAAVAGSGVPVLFIVGEKDATITPAVARGNAAKIPGAKVVEIEAAGHLSPLEKPQAVNDAIVQFVDSLTH